MEGGRLAQLIGAEPSEKIYVILEHRHHHYDLVPVAIARPSYGYPAPASLTRLSASIASLFVILIFQVPIIPILGTSLIGVAEPLTAEEISETSRRLTALRRNLDNIAPSSPRWLAPVTSLTL